MATAKRPLRQPGLDVLDQAAVQRGGERGVAAVDADQNPGRLRRVQGEAQVGADRARHAARRVVDAGVRPGDRALDVAADLRGDRAHQGVAVGEVVVEAALADLGGLDDVVDGHGVDRPLAEQPPARADQGGAGPRRPGVAGSVRRRHRALARAGALGSRLCAQAAISMSGSPAPNT